MSLNIEDIRVVYVGTIGLDGESADAVRMSAIEADHAALLAAVTAGHSLGSHNDVDFTGVADGQVPLWDAAANDGAGGWVAGDASGAISSVQNNAVDLMTDVHTLNAEEGLEFYDQGFSPGSAAIRVKYGGTGTSNSVARSDHSHTLPIVVFPTKAASGALSSGFRDLATTNITLAAGITYRIVVRSKGRVKGNGPGSSYYYEWIIINGVGYKSAEMQCVGGVPADLQHAATAEIVGTGASVTINATLEYSSGDPTDVRATYLDITATPAR